MAMTAPKPHPLFLKAAGDPWLDVTDIAVLIRSNLARAFPGVKFSVRSDRFAGGTSIDVRYDGIDYHVPIDSCYCSDGPTLDPAWGANSCRKCGYMGRYTPAYKAGMPTTADVDAIVKPFAGSGFDGMIDLSYSKDTWLNPDGSATYGASSGTTDSMGCNPSYSNPRPSPGAVMIHSGAKYVSVNADGDYVGIRDRTNAAIAFVMARKVGA